jgi:hypothetical protein
MHHLSHLKQNKYTDNNLKIHQTQPQIKKRHIDGFPQECPQISCVRFFFFFWRSDENATKNWGLIQITILSPKIIPFFLKKKKEKWMHEEINKKYERPLPMTKCPIIQIKKNENSFLKQCKEGFKNKKYVFDNSTHKK